MPFWDRVRENVGWRDDDRDRDRYDRGFGGRDRDYDRPYDRGYGSDYDRDRDRDFSRYGYGHGGGGRFSGPRDRDRDYDRGNLDRGHYERTARDYRPFGRDDYGYTGAGPDRDRGLGGRLNEGSYDDYDRGSYGYGGGYDMNRDRGRHMGGRFSGGSYGRGNYDRTDFDNDRDRFTERDEWDRNRNRF